MLDLITKDPYTFNICLYNKSGYRRKKTWANKGRSWNNRYCRKRRPQLYSWRIYRYSKKRWHRFGRYHRSFWKTGYRCEWSLAEQWWTKLRKLLSLLSRLLF